MHRTRSLEDSPRNPKRETIAESQSLNLKKQRKPGILDLHELADVRDVTKFKIQVIELALGWLQGQPCETNLFLVPETKVLTAKYFDFILRWPVWIDVLYVAKTSYP